MTGLSSTETLNNLVLIHRLLGTCLGTESHQFEFCKEREGQKTISELTLHNGLKNL